MTGVQTCALPIWVSVSIRNAKGYLYELRNRRLMVRAHSSALRATRTYVKFTFDESALSEIMSEINGPHSGHLRVIRSAPVAHLFPETRSCITTFQNRSTANPVILGTSKSMVARSIWGKIAKPLFSGIMRLWRRRPKFARPMRWVSAKG